MRIALDLDGVIANWCASVCADHGITEDQVTEWDSINDITGKSMKELYAICETNGTFGKLDAYEGQVEAVRDLIEKGHDIQFVTARPAFAMPETVAWLNAQFSDLLDDVDERVTILSNGESKSIVPADVYVDDSPGVLTNLFDELIGFENLWPAMIVRYNRPWNQNCLSFDAAIDTLAELPALLKEWEKEYGSIGVD